MSEVNIDALPPIVWDLWKDLLDQTDIEPVVRRVGYGQLELTHGNERVTVKVTFKNKSARPKWVWSSSSLHIDGKKVPKANGREQYFAILKDPDNGRYGYAPKGAKKAVIPQGRTVENEDLLPGLIRKNLRGLRAAKGCVTTVQYTNDSRYVLRVDSAKGKGAIVLIFKPGGDSWTHDDIICVNQSGYDVTNCEAYGIEEFAHNLLGEASRQVQVPTHPQRRTTQNVGFSNSVNVRNSTVFRI